MLGPQKSLRLSESASRGGNLFPGDSAQNKPRNYTIIRGRILIVSYFALALKPPTFPGWGWALPGQGGDSELFEKIFLNTLGSFEFVVPEISR